MLREMRRRRGLTLAAVGVLADVDPATVSRIERGLVDPQRSTIVGLARAFGVSATRMRALLDGEHERAAS